MEGREIGTPGLERAEAYVVDQLQKSGLAPAGTDGYYQPVQFESRQTLDQESSIQLVRNGKAERLTLGEDTFFTTLLNEAPRVEAPLAFVGYGLQVPEKRL